jgi:glycosyltransferase involved in cell wall biosynthesis
VSVKYGARITIRQLFTCAQPPDGWLTYDPGVPAVLAPLPNDMKRIAFLGNHLPRHCGIATFTTHIADAVAKELPNVDTFVLAMNDAGRRHTYPSRVRFEIAESDLDSYRRAADFLNVNQVDVLSVQHEYGIFGGKAGAHVHALLRELRIPIVTTLHTVLSAPNPAQRAVIDELARLSDRLVVMSASGAELLKRVHGISDDQIDLIPHGIPHVAVDPDSKDRLGVAGKTVILTFGLLSRDKGIEHVIDALPAIVSAHPETVYIILGATHPHVVEHEGETYRLMLEARGQQLGVAENLIFHNRFVSQDELNEFLSATDIYITPYLQPEQITSGTLAYALGAGKAVISTPYIYARELLAEGRGVLVPWRDSAAIADEVIALVSDDDRRRAMCARAAAYGVGMTWPAVAGRYVESFARAQTENTHRRRTTFRAQTLATRPAGLPEITLKHVQAMTDDTGILQHAIYSIPRYDDGYCLDDNARALLLMALLEDGGSDDPTVVRSLASRYLAFVSHAFDRTSGRFRNFFSYARHWLEPCGSQDSHGRALWALGAVVGRARDPGRYSLAGDLFHLALPAVNTFTSPRAWAYALLGIDEYLRAFQGDSTVEARRVELAERLLGLFQRTSRPDWPWFEDSVTYCNGRLSQALIVSGARMAKPDMIEAGMRSLDWLVSLQSSSDKQFAAIGSNGFYERGASPAAFDQQPVEACATASACLDAYRVHHDSRWLMHGRWAFNWFIGENHLQHWLFDPSTGGCRDGLHVDRPNQNQGAEATLSFLLALHELRTVTVVEHAASAQELQPTS